MADSEARKTDTAGLPEGVPVRSFSDVPRRLPAPAPGELAGLFQVGSATAEAVCLRTRDGVHLMLAASGMGSLVVWWTLTVRWAAVIFRVAPRAPGTVAEALLLWLLFGGWGMFGLLMLSQGGRRVTVERADRTFRSRWAWGLRRGAWSFEEIPQVTLALGAPRKRGVRYLTLSISAPSTGRDAASKKVLELGPINASLPDSATLVRVAGQIARVVGCRLVIEGWGEAEPAPAAFSDLGESDSPRRDRRK